MKFEIWWGSRTKQRWFISSLLNYKHFSLDHSQFCIAVMSLCALRGHLQPKQLVSSSHHHGDLVATADGLVDLLWGVHLHSVYLHHDVSRKYACSETCTMVLWVSSDTWKLTSRTVYQRPGDLFISLCVTIHDYLGISFFWESQKNWKGIAREGDKTQMYSWKHNSTHW